MNLLSLLIIFLKFTYFFFIVLPAFTFKFFFIFKLAYFDGILFFFFKLNRVRYVFDGC